MYNNSFSFNDVKKIYVLAISKKRPYWAPIKRNLISIPNRPGAYLAETNRDALYIEVDVEISSMSGQDLRKTAEDFASWLITEEPCELVFDDEPDRTYFAVVDGGFNPKEIVSHGYGTITFVCPDPHKYGEEKEAIFPSDVVSLNYEGTAPGDPIFELEVLQPVTFAMIQNQNDEYMMIGKPADVESEIVYTKSLLISEMGTTIGEWSTATPEMEGGSQGTIGYDGAGITAPSYGSGSGFHGPSIFKEVPLTQDFEVELRGQLYTDEVGQTGRFGFFLFDDQMREIAFMSAVDNSIYVNRKLAEGRIGPFIGDFKNYLISSRNYQKQWDNFPALLRLTRVGDTYTFYTARVLGGGKHMEPLTTSWTVWEDKFRGQLKYVGIFIDKHGTSSSPHTNRIDYIKVHALQQTTEDQTPYIAQPSDIITFDHKEKELLINGELRKDIKDFGARYFQLEKGENTLIVHPSNSFNVSCKYRERFK